MNFDLFVVHLMLLLWNTPDFAGLSLRFLPFTAMSFELSFA